MGASPEGLNRNFQVSQQQTKANLRPGAQSELQARAGFQQKGHAFERLMQDQAFQQRVGDQQRQASENQMQQGMLARQRMEEARASRQNVLGAPSPIVR